MLMKSFLQYLRCSNHSMLQWGSDHMLPREFVFHTFQNKVSNKKKNGVQTDAKKLI